MALCYQITALKRTVTKVALGAVSDHRKVQSTDQSTPSNQWSVTGQIKTVIASVKLLHSGRWWHDKRQHT